MSPNSDACGSGAGGGGMLPRSAVDRRAQPSSSSPSPSCDSSDSSRSSNGGSVAPIGCYRGGGSSPSGEWADRTEKRAAAPEATTTPLWLVDSGADEEGLGRGMSSCAAAADVGGGRSAGRAESATASDVVSVPLSELEGLVARLRVAKAQMWDLKKIVDMQTSIILGLKATIRARHERYGGAEETGEPVPTCRGYESRSPRPNPISSTSAGSPSPVPLLPTPALPAAAATFAAIATDRRRLPHTDDLRRTIAFAANAEVFCDRRPLSGDRAQSPPCPSPASSGVGRTSASVAAPQSRARTDFDSSCLTPASPPRTVPVALERNASNLTARDAAAAATLINASAVTCDDFGHRANLPSSVCSAASPYMFAARLPPAFSLSRPALREEPAYHRDAATPPLQEWSQAVPATAACRTGGAVESSWSGGSARDYTPSQLPAVVASGSAVSCHRRNGDPTVTGCKQDDELQAAAPDATAGAAPAAAAAAAVSVAGSRRCPFCRRAFAADVPVSDFQCHVLECDVSGEVVDATVGAAPAWAGCATSPTIVVPGGGCGSDDDRTCPLCAAHYPAGVPRDEFEQHVLSHFQDE